MPRALISVSDKTGIIELASRLTDLGWEIVSTGGTARKLTEAGVAVIAIDQVTGFPEMMDGRVKTLHPRVHGGLLALRDNAEHVAAMEEHGITPIDLVAVNLYPFGETIAKPDVSFAEAVEQIDIGGPSMLRSAAKNHQSVLVIVDPDDYGTVLDELATGFVSPETRRDLARKVFTHTASYDSLIASYMSDNDEGLPSHLSMALEAQQDLRYGENPAQTARLYRISGDPGLSEMIQHQGKELSYNNLLDLDAALMAIAPWQDEIACAVIKHTTPCGLALGVTAEHAFVRARATDPTSAFGSVVSFTVPVDAEAAESMSDLFVEVVVAPGFAPGALQVFSKKKNLRVLELPLVPAAGELDLKVIRGGVLAQERFVYSNDETGWTVATERKPTDKEWEDLRFAWAAVASVKSNAILLAKDNAAIGIGAGQMSRVDSSFIAVHKASLAGHDLKGCVLASDAFFPFADGIEGAARTGVTAVIQPGGSIRDEEVIAAANNHDVTMVMTGARQFRH